MKKYSEEWKNKTGKWVQKHTDATKGNIWKIHRIDNDTEYSFGEYFTAKSAREDLNKY